MMPGMQAFWAPARPRPRRFTCGRLRAHQSPQNEQPKKPRPRRFTCGRLRAHQSPQNEQPKKNSPQASPEMQTQQNTVNSSVLWLGWRARARASRPESQREQSKDRAAHEPATTKAKRTEQQFLMVFTAFCRARTQHRRHARQHRQRLAPTCVRMILAYIPPVPSENQCFMG